MELMEAVRHRRAVRDFLPDPIDRDTLRFLIDAAIQAPSGMNSQSWSFTVVTDRVVIDACADRAKAHALTAFGSDREHPELRRHLEMPDFHIFYHAPALILIAATEPGDMARIDCCLAAENLMLAATDRGLGTCWIGLAAPWLDLPEGKAATYMPQSHSLVAPIILGHPKAAPPAPPRREPHVTWIPGPIAGL